MQRKGRTKTKFKSRNTTKGGTKTQQKEGQKLNWSLDTQQQNKWCNEKEEQKLNWPNEAEKEIENKCCVDAS